MMQVSVMEWLRFGLCAFLMGFTIGVCLFGRPRNSLTPDKTREIL